LGLSGSSSLYTDVVEGTLDDGKDTIRLSLGYEEEFVKKKEINVEKEREVAAAWPEKQEKKGAIKKPGAKTNGHGKPSKRSK
jgi:hypothetical protein